ncbi:hypothetical protein Tco_1074316 [Tanacetum coccineum]
MICDQSWKIHDASLINRKYFEINDLKAQLQDKSFVVNVLKNQLAQLKGKSHVAQCESLNFDSRIQKIEDENVSLALQISENNKIRAKLKEKFFESQLNQNGTSVNTKFAKPPTSVTKLYHVSPLPKSRFIPNVVEKNDLIKTVTSHLTTNKIIEKCTKVLAPGKVSYTDASGLKPRINTKNDRIQ